MAAFFHGGSEIQDSASDLTLQQQNLFLMNPNPLPYPTTTTTTTSRFFNPIAAATEPLGHALVHAPPTDHLLVGVPTTVVPATSMDMSTSGHHPLQYHNLWFRSTVDPNTTHDINTGSDGSHGFELLPREPPPPLPSVTVVSPGNCKRLSLSLSSQKQPPRPPVLYMTSSDTDHIEQGNSPVSTVSNGVLLAVTQSGGGVLDPNFLKAARELLDEIVSVGNGEIAKNDNIDGSKEKLKMKKESAGDGISGEGGENGGSHNPVTGDMTAGHRQELQMKKAKLVSMVEEVEQRYRQYRHQMQTIVSSFEHAAGFGSAKPYTSLALQTISKQFRCLKDSISSQIKNISKMLGEDDCLGAKGESSRLRLVDHQLRHLRMIQHHHNNAWRPQRGLPERAVSVLRAWLFEHFLHPYPRDSDKLMLAKQTGLTRSQVSNWFINARVRLWKPMVEEMYLDEMKDQQEEQNFNEQHEDLKEGSSFKQPSNHAVQEHNNNNVSDRCSSSIVSTKYLAATQGIVSPQKKLRTINAMQNSSCSVVSFDVETKQQNHDHAANVAHFSGGFGTYNPAFGNSVSLSLGLPRSCDQTIDSFQFGTSHQIEFSGVSSSPAYQNIDISDKKRFAATAAAPLLPDFFA